MGRTASYAYIGPGRRHRALIGLASLVVAALGCGQQADRPVVQPLVLSIAEDGVATGQLTFSYLPFRSVTFSVVEPPRAGAVELDELSGAVVYRPAADFNGQDSFLFTVRDGAQVADPARVMIRVAAVNDAPVIVSVDTPGWMGSTIEGRPLIEVAEDDFVEGQIAAVDPDGQLSTFAVVAAPSHGALELDAASGLFTYRPFPDYNGEDAFSVVASDGQVLSEPAVVELRVLPVDDRPVALPQALQVYEDGALSGALRATDVDGPATTFAIVEGPAHGAIDLDAATGAFVYRPAPDHAGPDAFRFIASDGQLDSEPATVSIEVLPVNDPPVAQAQALVVGEDDTLVGALTASDVDSPELSYTVTWQPAHGTLVLDPASGVFSYRPQPNYDGPDEFRFTASDGQVDSEEAVVSLTVVPVNDPPVAWSQTHAIDEDTALTGRVTASDVDSPTLTYAVAVPPVHGVVTLDAATGAFTYQPAPDYNGPDQFSFVASDGEAESNVAVVSIEVLPVNDPPVAQAQAAQVDEDAVFAGQVMATDVDGDALIYGVVLQPGHGKLALEARSGRYTYKPDPDFNGSDFFVFEASDGLSTSAPAQISITVNPVEDPPVATALTLTTGLDGQIAGLVSAEDADGDALTYAVVTPPAHGALDFDPSTRAFTYRPAQGFSGDDVFQFEASDGLFTSAPATVSIRVQPTRVIGPRIEGQGGSATIGAGESTVLHVAAAGEPPLRYVWWKDGVKTADTTVPFLRIPPAALADNGTSYAVTVYDRTSGITSLQWTLQVVERETDRRVFSLTSNEAELFPQRYPLTVKSITRLPDGIGARVTFESPSQLPPMEVAGSGTVVADAAANAISISFQDSNVPEELDSAITFLSGDGTSRTTFGLSFTNTARLAQQGRAGPASLVVTEMGMPPAVAQVEDWVADPPTAADVAFAQATWGAVVSGFDAPVEKAQALARAIIDTLEGHRGVPSDRMNYSHPFVQYQLALSGHEVVWCSNIAAILSLASRSLGIPARIIAMGRYQSLGADYNLLTADGHASTEIFDDIANKWIWIDATFYVLGARSADGRPLNAAEFLRDMTDPGRIGALQVTDYDPASRSAATSPVAQSRQLPSLKRFFKKTTSLSYNKRGVALSRELYTNERDAYPRNETLALRSVRALPGDYGIEIGLASSIPSLDHFEYRETYSSDGRPDSAVKTTAGLIPIRFSDPHAPRGRAKIYAFRAVSGSGAASAERTVTIWYYSREFYASYGQSNTGVLILDDGDIPWTSSLPDDWIVDRPSLADVLFARTEWGGAAAGAAAPLEKAQAIAGAVLARLTDRQGVPSDEMNAAAPFDAYRRAVAGRDRVDSVSLSAILARACNSLGIPARVVRMGRSLSDAADYRLLGAAERAAVEVFDSTRNQWVWLDVSVGMLGMEQDGLGYLNAIEVKRRLSDPDPERVLRAIIPDAVTGAPIAVPLSGAPGTVTLQKYLATYPILRHARKGATGP